MAIFENSTHLATIKSGTLADDLTHLTGKKYARIEELDSMRGIAAINVVVYHFCLIMPAMAENTHGSPDHVLLNIWKYSPLSLIGSGAESVVFFFVLSGFVLALPYHGGKVDSYQNFLIRRILRLYPPYLIALAVVIGIRWFLPIAHVGWASGWFNEQWQSSLDMKDILRNISFVLDFDCRETVGPAWSLVHEMRISIIFPAILILTRLIPSRGLLFLSVAASFACYYYLRLAHTANGFLLTGMYVEDFVLGAVLAKHFDYFKFKFERLSRTGVILTGIGALICYTYSMTIFPSVKLLHLAPLNLLPVSLASAWAIVCGVQCTKVSAVLRLPVIKYFGKTSYSLYLYHEIVLLAAIHLFNGKMPLWCLLALALGITLIITDLSYSFVELPSIALGRRFFSSRGRAATV